MLRNWRRHRHMPGYALWTVLARRTRRHSGVCDAVDPAPAVIHRNAMRACASGGLIGGAEWAPTSGDLFISLPGPTGDSVMSLQAGYTCDITPPSMPDGRLRSRPRLHGPGDLPRRACWMLQSDGARCALSVRTCWGSARRRRIRSGSGSVALTWAPSRSWSAPATRTSDRATVPGRTCRRTCGAGLGEYRPNMVNAVAGAIGMPGGRCGSCRLEHGAGARDNVHRRPVDDGATRRCDWC